MTDLRKAAEMALDALERCEYGVISNGRLKNSIEALRQALAHPDAVLAEREACAKVCEDWDTSRDAIEDLYGKMAGAIRARSEK